MRGLFALLAAPLVLAAPAPSRAALPRADDRPSSNRRTPVVQAVERADERPRGVADRVGDAERIHEGRRREADEDLRVLRPFPEHGDKVQIVAVELPLVFVPVPGLAVVRPERDDGDLRIEVLHGIENRLGPVRLVPVLQHRRPSEAEVPHVIMLAQHPPQLRGVGLVAQSAPFGDAVADTGDANRSRLAGRLLLLPQPCRLPAASAKRWPAHV